MRTSSNSCSRGDSARTCSTASTSSVSSVPPLRERRDEIPALVHHFVGRAAQEFGKARVRLAQETMEHLILYPWPGNVRQLHNELRRMVALAESDTVLGPSALSKEILRATPRIPRGNGDPEISVPLSEKLLPTLSRVEREMIKAALKTNEGKVEAAARALGISRKGLYLKRQRLGLLARRARQPGLPRSTGTNAFSYTDCSCQRPNFSPLAEVAERQTR